MVEQSKIPASQKIDERAARAYREQMEQFDFNAQGKQIADSILENFKRTGDINEFEPQARAWLEHAMGKFEAASTSFLPHPHHCTICNYIISYLLPNGLIGEEPNNLFCGEQVYLAARYFTELYPKAIRQGCVDERWIANPSRKDKPPVGVAYDIDHDAAKTILSCALSPQFEKDFRQRYGRYEHYRSYEIQFDDHSFSMTFPSSFNICVASLRDFLSHVPTSDRAIAGKVWHYLQESRQCHDDALLSEASRNAILSRKSIVAVKLKQIGAAGPDRQL